MTSKKAKPANILLADIGKPGKRKPRADASTPARARRRASPSAVAKAEKPRGPGRPRGALNKVTRTVRELAADHGPTAVATLAELMADEEQPGIVRVAAARDLLDRAYGKAPQYIEVDAAIETTAMSREERDALYAEAMASAAAQRAQMVERRRLLEAEDARERGARHE